MLAISDDPQSTRAWAVGARGEELLGKRLDGLTARGVRVLHDRHIPRTKANIDHIAVGHSGVFVIDAKRYQGRPSLRVEGGMFRPRTEKLMVGSRDCTKLVAGVHKQLDLVRAALERTGSTDVPLRGMLCFVNGDWPLIGGSFAIDDLYVLWPKKASEHLISPGPYDDAAGAPAPRSRGRLPPCLENYRHEAGAVFARQIPANDLWPAARSCSTRSAS